MPTGTEVEAHELELFMENDRGIYRREGFFILNAVRKKRKGTYDAAKAPKLWLHLADEGARAYTKEHGSGTGFGAFNKQARMLVAERYARAFEKDYDAGEYTNLDVKPKAPNPHELKDNAGDLRGE
jgi:hypothetical protein